MPSGKRGRECSRDSRGPRAQAGDADGVCSNSSAPKRQRRSADGAASNQRGRNKTMQPAVGSPAPESPHTPPLERRNPPSPPKAPSSPSVGLATAAGVDVGGAASGVTAHDAGISAALRALPLKRIPVPYFMGQYEGRDGRKLGCAIYDARQQVEAVAQVLGLPKEGVRAAGKGAQAAAETTHDTARRFLAIEHKRLVQDAKAGDTVAVRAWIQRASSGTMKHEIIKAVGALPMEWEHGIRAKPGATAFELLRELGLKPIPVPTSDGDTHALRRAVREAQQQVEAAARALNLPCDAAVAAGAGAGAAVQISQDAARHFLGVVYPQLVQAARRGNIMTARAWIDRALNGALEREAGRLFAQRPW